MAIRFFWNGLKVDGSNKLHTGWWSVSAAWTNYGRAVPAHITFYAKHYGSLPAEVHAAFAVENGTDTQTDYFETDRFTITPSHPLFSEVVDAVLDKIEHDAARFARKGCDCSSQRGDIKTLAKMLKVARGETAAAPQAPAPADEPVAPLITRDDRWQPRLIQGGLALN
jgi:hypothetical protein